MSRSAAEAQVYLYEAALSRLSFDNAKERVLLTLIANPDFSSAAERTVLEKLDKLAFPSSRKRILKDDKWPKKPRPSFSCYCRFLNSYVTLNILMIN